MPRPSHAEPCQYPQHRGHDWTTVRKPGQKPGRRARIVCGVCHPPAADVLPAGHVVYVEGAGPASLERAVSYRSETIRAAAAELRAAPADSPARSIERTVGGGFRSR